MKTALAVMRSLQSLKYTAEDLQKVPDLVATMRKVRMCCMYVVCVLCVCCVCVVCVCCACCVCVCVLCVYVLCVCIVPRSSLPLPCQILLKVRRYRDSGKVRKKANEVYRELHVLFAQGEAASNGGHSAGASDGEKATPQDQDKAMSWDVIDTNDEAAVKSIKAGSEGKPPSPSPRRSQRSSVKNNRVDYSKLLEEDGFDDSDDQQVPM